MTQSAFPTALEWHQARRAQGLPTLSVLVGPPGLGVRAWRTWCQSRGTSTVQTNAVDPTEFGFAWANAVFEQLDCERASCEWFYRTARRKPEEFQPLRMTLFDLDQVWEAAPFDRSTPTATVAHAILREVVQGQIPTAKRLFDEPLARVDPLRLVFVGLSGLTPKDRWPSLVTLSAGPDKRLERWTARLRVLEALIGICPALPVAICLPTSSYAAAVDSLGNSRIAAILREGAVHLEGVSGRQLNAQLLAANVDPLPPSATLDRLTGDGLPADVAQSFVEAAAAARSLATEPERASEFRSLAEKALFELLESRPETAGLFLPNRRLEFLHGVRKAEADLVAENLKIIVELDGKYYHLNENTYRADRRKDWLYQRHGYWVLRFLSEDVVEDLAPILDTILEAVALRRSSIPGPEVATRD